VFKKEKSTTKVCKQETVFDLLAFFEEGKRS
jgi:hypothetical protein